MALSEFGRDKSVQTKCGNKRRRGIDEIAAARCPVGTEERRLPAYANRAKATHGSARTEEEVKERTRAGAIPELCLKSKSREAEERREGGREGPRGGEPGGIKCM